MNKRNLFVICMIFMVYQVFCTDVNPYWDGYATVRITRVDVTQNGNCDFRVMTNNEDLFNDTDEPHDPVSWAYLNESDVNYETYVAMLSMAFMMDYDVVIHVKKVDNYAHIGYISIRK